jgi:hypothetical protein
MTTRGSSTNPYINWIKISDFQIIERDAYRPQMFVKVECAELKRATWFQKSANGNFCKIGKAKLTLATPNGFEFWEKDIYMLVMKNQDGD